MPIQSQLVDVIFKEGVDTKTGSDHILASALTTARNVRMDKTGVISPRPAIINYSSFSTSSNFSGAAFDAISDEASLVTAAKGILWSSTANRNLALGTLPRGGLARAYYGEVSNATMHIAASDTQVCMVWSDTSQPGTPRLGLTLQDAATSRVVYQNIITLPSTDGLQVVYTGGSFYVIYSSTHSLRALQLDLTLADSSFPFNPCSWGSPPTGASFVRFAATAIGNKIYVASAVDLSTTVNYQVLTVSGTSFTVSLTTTAFTTTSAAKCISITALTVGTSDFAIAAAQDFNPVLVQFFTASGAPVGTTSSLATAASAYAERMRFSATKFNSVRIHLWGIDSVTGTGKTYRYGVDSNGPQSSATPFASGLAPITGSLRLDSQDTYIGESYTATSYGSQGMLGDQNYTPVLVSLGVSMNLGVSLAGELAQLPNPVQVGNKIFYCLPAVTGVTAVSSNPNATTPNDVIQRTVDTTFKKQATMLTWDLDYRGTSFIEKNNGQRLYIGTGAACLAAPAISPGVWPEPLTKLTDSSVITAGAVAAGVVSFVLAKKFISPDGVEYRTYSEIYSVNMTANKQLQVAVTQWDFNPLANQSIAQPLTMELYRTERNGIIFYLAGSRVSAGNLTDTLDDASLVKQRTADINGNELPTTLIPSARLVTKYNDRLAIVPADFPNKIFFEKPGAQPQGTVFASGLEVELNDEGGNITGIIQMDQSLYIFKRNQILTMSGELPGPTGEGGTLNTPRILTNGVGCVDPRSLILTKSGVVFKSEKGFYLIARNQILDFVGEGPYIDRTVQVTGCGISSDQPEVYFAHSNGDIWVLNLDNGGWYLWYCITPVGGLTTSNNLTHLVTDTDVLTFDNATHEDIILGANLPVPQIIETGWIRLNNLRGYQRTKRLYLLGETLGNHTVTVSVYTDYSDTAVQTFTAALVVGKPLQVDLHISVQKCETFKFRVSTNQYGLSLSGATLEIGTKEGPDKSRTSSSNPR